MYDRDLVATLFSNLKSLNERAAQKKELLDKNIKAIAEPDGTIPPRYEKALEKLNKECASLQSQVDSGDEVMLKVAQQYIRDGAMGWLVYEKNNEGTKYFVDAYADLLDENFSLISATLNAFDLDKLDSIITEMREKFLENNFKRYCEYAKTLSFNQK